MDKKEYSEYASVILDVAIDKPLDYGITEVLEGKIKKGAAVEVPLRGHARRGYVIDVKKQTECQKVQPIKRLLSEDEPITSDLFELALWMAKYYCASLGDVFKTILPSSIRKEAGHKQQLFVMRKRTREELKNHCQEIREKHPAQAEILEAMLKVKKGILLTELLEKTNSSRSPVDTLAKQGWLTVDVVRIDRSPLVNEEYFQAKPKELNEDQKISLQRINASIEEARFETHLLYGITGSGKTEVYLQAIEKNLSLKRGAIILVPEISLTAQTIERFRSRFEGHIAILHHRLSHGERFDEWHRIRKGEAQIVIGARSAVFSPVQDLGLIIVDEEHEASYKQNDSVPCYHARDLAVMRGKLAKCAVILGSATPSLESFYNASAGKYTLSTLHSRADTASLPRFTIVDMKKEFEKAKGFTNFSDPLIRGIKDRFTKGEQTILFLNRRGYHTMQVCTSCGKGIRCRHCDVALTFHLGENHLSCHLCGYHISPPPSSCPTCKDPNPMKFRGVGTELIQSSLHAILPDIRTIRLDADTTRHKGSHQKLLRDFATGKADVLIGTQMIAKGLHFPQVTLVGVLNSDASLNIPDFRASETAFQLITQVAGRAGRGAIAGEVIVQTSLPDNPTVLLAASQNFPQFYEDEIAVRKMFAYPPFSHLAKLSFSGTNPTTTKNAAELFRQKLIQLLPRDFTIHTVIPAGHAKVKDKFRFQLLLRGPNIYTLSHSISSIYSQTNFPKNIKILIDINPLSTFF